MGTAKETSSPTRDTTAAAQSSALQAVQDAAQLVRHCDTYWRDQIDRADGWHIDYAVDVDVIKLYTAPDSNLDYAEVFHGPGQDQRRPALARLLGDSILTRLAGHVGGQQTRPGALFIVSAHAQEYDRVRRAIALEALAQGAQAEDKLPNLIAHLVAHKTRPNVASLAKSLVSEYRSLIEAFDGESGPLQELKRLAALPHGRLLNITRAEVYSGFRATDGVATGRAALLPHITGSDQRDRAAYFERVEYWLGALRSQAPDKADRNLSDDAQVLATLEWVNQRAFVHKRRVVLVTGTQSLFKAGEHLHVRGADGQLTRFSRYCLRDPRAFIGQRDFLPLRLADMTRDPDGLGVLDWVNQFFPRAVTQERRMPVHDTTDPSVRRFASVNLDELDCIEHQTDETLKLDFQRFVQAQRDKPGAATFPENLLIEWSTVVQGAVADQAFNPEHQDAAWEQRAQRLVIELNKRLGNGFSVEKIQKGLRDTIHTAIQRLYLVTGDVGLLQTVGDGELVRGVPALRFEEGYPRSSKWCDKLGNALWSADHAFEFSHMYTEVMDEDPSGYHSNLLHALAYSAGGHWLLTRQYCINALHIVERLPTAERRGRLGREAAYLQAVAERRVALSAEDLDAARKALADARQRDFERPEHVDPRFESEALALMVTEYQFDRFANAAGATGSLTEGVKRRASKHHKGRNKSPLPLQEGLTSAPQILDAVSRDSDPAIVVAWVTRQVATNVMLLALYAAHDGRPDLSCVDVATVVHAMDVFRDRQLAPDSPEKKTRDGLRPRHWNNALSSFIYSVAVLVFVTDIERRKSASRYLKQLDEAKTLEQLRKPRAPFEKQRTTELKDLARRFASAPICVGAG